MKPSRNTFQTIEDRVIAELELCKIGATTTSGIEQKVWLARWDATLKMALLAPDNRRWVAIPSDPFATAEPCWKGGR